MVARTELTKSDPRDIQLPGARLTATEMIIEGDPTFEQCCSYAGMLERIRGAHKWWIGDYIRFMQAHEQKWGQKYDQALAHFPEYTYDELSEFTSVAKAVPPENRRADLSWSHHAAVKTLPPAQQAKLLDAGLTRDEIRREVRRLKGPVKQNSKKSNSGAARNCESDAEPDISWEAQPSQRGRSANDFDWETGEFQEELYQKPIQDKTGHDVPEKLRPSFWMASAVREHLKSIRTAVQKINSYAEHPGGERLASAAVQVSHKDLRSAVEAGLPHAVCPICIGQRGNNTPQENATPRDNCQACDGYGWVHKDRWNGIPKEKRGR